MPSDLSPEEPATPVPRMTSADHWVDRYGDALYRYAMAKTGDNAVAEDLVQDTLLAGFKRQDSFRKESTVSTWLFSILKNKIADHYRSALRRPPTLSLDVSESDLSDGVVGGRSRSRDARDPAALSEDAEFQKIFESCVERLPNKLAEVYALKEVNEHSLPEIREILGISPTNLSMRLHRCRLALKECLQTHWFQESE